MLQSMERDHCDDWNHDPVNEWNLRHDIVKDGRDCAWCEAGDSRDAECYEYDVFKCDDCNVVDDSGCVISSGF